MHRYLSLLVALFLTVCGHSQPASDSVMIKKEKDAYTHSDTDPKSAILIAEDGIQQSQRSGDTRLAAYAYRTLGWAFFHQGNYDSCFADLLTAVRLFTKMHDTLETMFLYSRLALVYSNHSQFAESAMYLIKADSLAKMENNGKIEAAIKRQMGILYRQQGDYRKAVAYLKEGVALYAAQQDTLGVSDAISSICIAYTQYLNEPDSSLFYLKKYHPLLTVTAGFLYQRATMHEQFGDAYYKMTDYKKALDHYKEAWSMFVSADQKADIFYEAINVGKAYTQLKDFDQAEKFLKKAYSGSDSLHLTNYAHDAAHELAALYEQKGDWKKAFTWIDIKFRLKDSMQLAEQNRKAEELQAKYEAGKKDAEISLLKKDQDLSRLTLQRQKTFRYGAIALLILLALVASLVVNRYRLVQQAKRQLEMEKLRHNIARDLHDDMGSALSSINIISKVALESPGEKEDMRGYFKKIQNNSGYMMESMSDIVWAINPVNDNFEQLIIKMREFAADILEPLNIRYEFVQKGDSSLVEMGLDKRKDLYFIFKEAINNAAKYSACTEVTTLISLEKEEITLQVKDNGRGFDVAAVPSGNGLRNMRKRAEQMMGRVDITSEKGKGTMIYLQVKLRK